MRLKQVKFEDVMELDGDITFPEGKTIVIHGENKAGKSNIIHALRYAFLGKVKRGGKGSGYDELKLVTPKEMVASGGVGKVSVEFEHNGREFEIHRELNSYGDTNRIYQKEPSGVQELDFNSTINKELKAGLLDALFAPDSAMGFNHLNEKNIDAVIRELFKEIGNAKLVAQDFGRRLERLNEAALTGLQGISGDYESFASSLKDMLRETPVALKDLERYEAGRTADKIKRIADWLKDYVDSFEKGEFKGWLQGMKERAEAATGMEALLTKSEEIKARFSKWQAISEDEKRLGTFLEELKESKQGGPVPPEPGSFHDEQLDRMARDIHQRLSTAQGCHSTALSLAEEQGFDLAVDNPDAIRREKEKMLQLLGRQVLTPGTPRVETSLVKIEDSVHAIVSLELMTRDSAFTRLSPEPIPEAPEEEKKAYAETLRAQVNKLSTLCENKKKADQFFSEEFLGHFSRISSYSTRLNENRANEQDQIAKFVDEVRGKLLTLFAPQRVEVPKMEDESDAEPFFSRLGQVLSQKKSNCKEEVNKKATTVGLEINEFNPAELERALSEIQKKEPYISSYKQTWEQLTSKRMREWEDRDADYMDLGCVPSLVDGINRILGAILDNVFDEQEVIQGIKEIITEINGQLVAEGLVNSCIEMTEDSLQLDKTTYKDRQITHPCGAERSFFSLAVLTALARYFGLPVIIDEAANNLDRNNLPRFLSLVVEFAGTYGVQYILSIKETGDFPLDGWVRELADDLQVYSVYQDGERKRIKLVELA